MIHQHRETGKRSFQRENESHAFSNCSLWTCSQRQPEILPHGPSLDSTLLGFPLFCLLRCFSVWLPAFLLFLNVSPSHYFFGFYFHLIALSSFYLPSPFLLSWFFFLCNLDITLSPPSACFFCDVIFAASALHYENEKKKNLEVRESAKKHLQLTNTALLLKITSVIDS